ncbi:MAG TPA: Gfo/Idh/MocA family oxidoreductase [Saprospiraceae bacterium]|nr:Gfo/Idh/MocA family oxidoreductase [Saprospiraceae bacterium]HNT20702.1 Gfo/Idh/MocA family oxidoreductase [Saprospiraceae bacterium]
MFKWGIIGLGRIANKFAKELKETGVGELAAVGSRDITKAEAFAKEYGAARAFGSYEELVGHGGLDAVYVATPHHLHAYCTSKCLEAGLPVLCEKPFTINKHELTGLIHQARVHQVFLMEAMWTRFLPHILYLKSLHDSGRLGRLLHLRADFAFKGKERASAQGVSRLVVNELGGGSLLDIGVYPVFLAQLLLGVPAVIQAEATILNEIDETCQVILKDAEGITAYLESSILWESDTSAQLFYEKGSVLLPRRWHERGEMIIKPENGEAEIKNWDYPNRGFYYQIKEVQDCVQAGKLESDLMPLHFSLQIMDTLDRIRTLIGLKYPADLMK